MIMAQWYHSVRPLKYKKIAGQWCYCHKGIYRSLCITFAIKLLKLCHDRVFGLSIECVELAKNELDKYLKRIGVSGVCQTS